MTESEKSIAEYSPDKLLSSFTRSGFIRALCWAITLHVVVIGLSSILLLFKSSPQEEAKTEQAASAETQQTELIQQPDQTAASPQQVTGAEETKSEKAGRTSKAQDRTNTIVMKEITEAASPEEIPDKPGDLGISIEDTNP